MNDHFVAGIMGKQRKSNQLRSNLLKDKYAFHSTVYRIALVVFFDRCFMVVADNESQLSSSPDSATWTGVRSSTYISLGTALIFMFIFEFGRRHPAVATVFDRRRQTNPNRTPPPLIKSRICEWLFLRTDPAYLLYAEKLDNKEKERKVRQQATTDHNCDLQNQDENENDHDRNIFHRLRMLLRIAGKGIHTKAFSEVVPPKSTQLDEIYGCTYPSDSFTQNTISSNSLKSSRQIPMAADTECQRRIRADNVKVGQLQGSDDDKSSSESSSSSYFGDYSEDEQSCNSDAMDKMESGNNRKIRKNNCLTPSSDNMNVTKQKRPSVKESSEVVCVNKFKIPKDLVNYVITSDFPLKKLEELESHSRRNSLLEEKATKEQLQAEDHESVQEIHVHENNGFSNNVSEKVAGKKEECQLEPLDRRKGTYRKSRRKHILLECTEQVHNKHPLTVADQELLRCVGLDLFVSLRFLRFCFDVSFYPFLAALVILIPTYYTNDYEGTATTVTNGYFQFTMNRLQNGSPRLWICFVFSLCFYLGVLRRLWVEWETFIPLRYEFLANGDSEAIKEQDHVEQYR
jgi:hypothetical protein